MAKDADPRSAQAEEPVDTPEVAVPDPARRRKLIIAAAAVAGLTVAGAGAWFFMHRAPSAETPAAAEGEAAEAPAEAPAEEGAAERGSGPPQYVALTPAFVVNLEDDEALRYMQIDIEVMARDTASIDAVKLHMPVIRNNLLLLFGQKHYHDLDTREGKEKLRAEALAEVQQVLREETGKPGVEALYFTSFVMQ